MAATETQEHPDGTGQQNGDHVNAEQDTNGETAATQDQADRIYNVTVKLPHAPGELKLTVAGQEQVQDLRQSIVEYPDTFQYSCFHLEHNGERINDFIELSSVKDLSDESVITLHEDPYTEKEARMHMLRVKDLIGASGERVEPLYGLAAGSSVHDDIAAGHRNEDSANDKVEEATVSAVENYDFGATPSLDTLIPKSYTEGAPKTIKSLTLSPWNPPPLHLRLKGHLMYLFLTTLSGANFFITSHSSGFWVNKSGQDKFDPMPKVDTKSGNRQFAHSLLGLIAKVDSGFDAKFKELQEYNSQRDPLNNFQITNILPAAPWIVSASELQHRPDASRTQEMWLNSGNETTENLRDWNEEFQSTKELPKEQVQERVFRERVTNKLFADYTEAAARGAMLVARGELAPLNPTEQKEAQIFVHNNVFYSFGADGMGTFTTEGGDEAARVAVGKDINGVRIVSQLDIDSLFTPGTIVVDYMGRRIVGQSIVPGIFKQREPGEHQIDYGGVEGRDIVTTNEEFVEPFKKLSKALKIQKHPVWDKEGKRHDLEGSVETKGLLGTDGRKYVLDLYRLTPLDIAWLKEHWMDAVEGETKPKERNYPHRMAVLRQELVDAYWRNELSTYVSNEYQKRQDAKKEEAKDEAKDEAKVVDGQENGEDKEEKPQEKQERIDISGFDLAFNPDVYSGQNPPEDAEKEKLIADEKKIEELCRFLRETSIPNLLKELKEGEAGFPMDGQSLSRLLHKRGINIRYLGYITKQARAEVTENDRRLQALVTLTTQEMVTRAFKHVANRYLRNLPAPFVQTCASHLLNCLLGVGLNTDPKAQIDEDLKALYDDADFSFLKVTPDSLKQEIEAQVHLRFRYDIESTWQGEIRYLQVLREVSLKLGLQLKNREYHFSPAANGASTNGTASKSKKKRDKLKDKRAALRESSSSESLGAQQQQSAPATFSPEDIVNIVPVVKDSTPRSNLAEEALEAGRLSINQNNQELGQELLFEGMSLHEQIYGVLHPEVARVYHTLSMLYYQLGDTKLAVDLARKAVIVSERVLGLDASETVLSYLNLGLFEHANGHSSVALKYVSHALDLWKLTFGPIESHPDSITTINNAAVMLQSLRQYKASRTWFEKSRQVAIDLSGPSSVSVATLSFQLAQALALDRESKAAVNMMREARDTFSKELGEDNKNTQEASEWVKQLVTNSVNIEKHTKNMNAARANRLGGRSGLLGGTRITPQVGQSANPSAPQPRVEDTRTPEEIAREIEGFGKQAKNTPKKNASGKTPARRK